MLDLAKVEAGKLEIQHVPTRPGSLLVESLVMLRFSAEKAKVDLVVDGDPSSWPVLDGDPVKLKQVFVNLIGNAIKFTPEGGRVTVSGETSNDELRVRIRDTGIGICAKEIPLGCSLSTGSTRPSTQNIKGRGLDCHLRNRSSSSTAGHSR